MAHSLEARCPMLDRAVVEYAMGIPIRTKIVRGETKYLLRQAFADLIPAEILHASKKGFASPVRWWLNEQLSTQLDAVLSPARLRRTGVLNAAGVEAMRKDKRFKRMPLKLWSLLVLQIWAEQYLNPGASA
jgi:asparagine synthase (glutamine-hydrolysing)